MRFIILFLLSFLLNAGIVYSIDCARHPIYCKIKELRPNMDNKEAMRLSNIIYKYADKRKGDDPILAVAIAMQETGLRKVNRKQSVIQFNEKCDGDKCTETWAVIKGVSDICLFQFHVGTILHYNMNPVRLKNDLNYCVQWHFKLMRVKRKKCKNLGDHSWGCYHSANKILRNNYIKLVERYL